MSAPIATVRPGFSAALGGLAASSAAIGAALSGTGRRAWQSPPTGAWAGDPLDVQGMSKAFDRADLNADYGRAVADGTAPGTVGDVAGIKAQIDWMGSMERAYRARSATPCRLLAFAAARRRGHGDQRGVLLGGGVLGYAEDAIRAGGDGGTPG